ncbi:DNA recombination protein RmuC [Arcobacter roscoffensis]|uniref:DNA recombination protein RmuC n=1 Tax=Arcobacter roscoffensis TaxID=2961520 RepID=A0ABY5E199_9BACT|nr:DNA recombination protein RmuC [Arcobacter roscoffensis]UTJ05232.1 DNA recombination protein RmuC [Arcobacter roscoffensis]
MNSVIEINTLTLILSIIAITLAVMAILHFTKRNYNDKLQNLQDEVLLKINTANEKIELTSSFYEDKIKAIQNQSDQIQENLIETYELRLENLTNEFKIKEDSFNEKINLLEESKEKMKIEFESLATKVFEQNQKKSNVTLNQLLTPFKEQLDSFGKRVNDIYNEETKQRSSLLTEIKNLKELNQQISTDAVNLTKALKGDNKAQGDWGEMILSSILEQTGLREGKEYSTQGSFTDEHGKRLRPDVIVHLPSNKDIIIDSKVSLKAYIDYTNSEDNTKKAFAKKELVKSVTAHIKGLSSKKYEDIEGVRTLDFVLLFIPIEGAFLLASTEEENLFKLAFEHNIMLVSPSTLFVTLRTIENIWRNEQQHENALLIAKKAGYLYDKFALFVKDLEEVGTHINRTQKSYDNAMKKLSTGNGNLLKRSQEFIDLGVKPKKQIDNKNLLEEE